MTDRKQYSQDTWRLQDGNEATWRDIPSEGSYLFDIITENINEQSINLYLERLEMAREYISNQFTIEFTAEDPELYPNYCKILVNTPAKYQSTLNQLTSASSKECLEILMKQDAAGVFGMDPRFGEVAAMMFTTANARPGHPVIQYCRQQARFNEVNNIRFPGLPNPAADAKYTVSKYVPHRSHLALPDFDSSELLTIFNEPEQQLFELAIGRALYGINIDTFADGSQAVASPWRYACLILGDPAIGKSVLMSSIKRAAEALGYSAAEFNTLGKQFGIEDIISKDFALSDDLKTSTLKSLIESSSFKSIVSGAVIRTEQKNKREKETQSRGLIMANINRFQSGILMTADQGVLNRLKVLQCKSASELAEDEKTFQRIELLKEKYQCTEQDIFNAFFRNCVDAYTAEISGGTLVSTVNKISSQLSFILPVEAHSSFCDLLQISTALAFPKDKLIPRLNGAIFRDSLKYLHWFATSADCNAARTLLKEDWKSKGRQSNHAWLIFRSLDIPGITEAAMLAETLGDMQTGNLNSVLKQLLESVRLTDGFKIAAFQDIISSAWDDSAFLLRQKYHPALEKMQALNLEYTAPKDYTVFLSPDFDREKYCKK